MKRIKLTQGYFATVDDEDYESLSKHKWQAQKCGKLQISYRAYRTARKGEICKYISMSSEIMTPSKGLIVDHINHDSLDNRRKNLRICTLSQNQQNKRKQLNHKNPYKGINFNISERSKNRWVAYVTTNGKQLTVGSFRTPKEAAIAYDKKATELYGEFACVNFPALEQLREVDDGET